MLLVAAGVSGGLVYRHLNGNIDQVNIGSLVGKQPPNLHPRAENILLIGSDSRQGLGPAYAGLTTDQSDTMMLVHIPASRQWAEVMSIPRDSWVNIPACTMGNGEQSSPTQFKINEAFALGSLSVLLLRVEETALGAACTVKTLERDTGVYINHFVVVNFAGFEGMVAALGGVPECNPAAFTDPASGIMLSAGYHMLTPPQALAYVRARYGLGDGSDLGRIIRQQAFVSSLITRARSELLNPLAIYRFLDSATSALTIDSQLGGIAGIYDLEQSLRGIPSAKIAFFTVPNRPRGDGANVLWSEPAASEIFASFRDDTPASPSLFAAAVKQAGHGKFGVDPSVTPSAPASIPAHTANQSICVG